MFDELADPDKMSRCTRLLSQNCNESIHARLFRMILKGKFHKYYHIDLAALLTTVIHNLGYEQGIGSMYKHYGAYLKEEIRNFINKDNARLANAEKKHQDAKIKSRHHGRTPLDKEPSLYCPGFMFEDHILKNIAEFEKRHVQRQNNLPGDQQPQVNQPVDESQRQANHSDSEFDSESDIE